MLGEKYKALEQKVKGLKRGVGKWKGKVTVQLKTALDEKKVVTDAKNEANTDPEVLRSGAVESSHRILDLEADLNEAKM